MNNEDPTLKGFLQLLQPQLLIWIFLTYSIGPALVHFQGGTLEWGSIILGSLLAVFLVLMQSYLSAFFDHPESPTCRLHRDDERYLMLKRLDRQTLLVVAMTLLTAGAVDTVLLTVRHGLNLPAVLILGIGFLITFFSASPPLRLEKSGYGEIVEAILVCNLVPALGFLMSESNLHVLLVMLTLPLTLVYLAYKVVLSLESFAFDSTHKVQSLAVRLDWKKAMQAHNYLILTAFLFIVIFSLIGQPWSITWPILLTIPVGIYQIVQMVGIISGAPTRWKVLKLTASGLFVIMAYLISFTLWIK